MIELRHNIANVEERSGGLSAVRTPGQHLKDARERAGLEAGEVASSLRISEAYVNALEGDRYEKLPAEPFVLGYLRAYAKRVNLCPESLVASYREYRGHLNAIAEPAKFVVIEEEQANPWLELLRKNIKTIGVVSGALLLLVLVYVFFTSSTPVTPVVETESVPAQPAPTQPIPTQQQPAEPAPAGDRELQSPTPDRIDSPVEEGGSGPTQEIVRAVIPASAPPHEQHLDQLLLEFSAECWLQVTDARGDVLATNLYQKGQSLRLQGEAPFDIVLGNVHAARVRLNDSDVTLVAREDSNHVKTSIGRP